MKFKIIFVVLIIQFILCAYSIELREISDSKPTSESITKTINTIPPYDLKESNEVYRTTAYDSRLLPNPNSNIQLTRIPPNTKLIILDKKSVQQGRMLNNWYKVNYNGYTGWTSGWNMEESEEIKINYHYAVTAYVDNNYWHIN